MRAAAVLRARVTERKIDLGGIQEGTRLDEYMVRIREWTLSRD